MKLRDIIIAAVWVYSLGFALYGGFENGRATEPVGPPVAAGFAWFLWLFPFPFFAVGGFLQRRRLLFSGGWPQRWADGKWGVGAFAAMIMRLRPVALFMLTGLALGLTTLISNYAHAQNWTAYVNGGFMLSAGLGLLVAYVLSLRFPPRLY